jgi:geranylgeranyl diphosphate synthase type II
MAKVGTAPIEPGAAAEDRSLSDLWDYAFRHRPAIDHAIEASLPSTPAGMRSVFNEAVHRAIFPGGKRIRPLVTLLGAELFGGSIANVLQAAAAVEFIHTSSLIFDDLPSMDDASHRRGEAALHRRYGEGMATLVAISFLNASYRMVLTSPAADADRVRMAVDEIVECVGPCGMIGGQVVDLTEFGPMTSAEVRRRNDLKTSSLIRLSLNLGAILSGAGSDSVEQLTLLASKLGDAYQKRDDLNDLVEDERRFRSSETDVPGVISAPFERNDHGARQEFLRIGVRRDIADARDILTSHFPPSNARECLLQLATYVAQ